MPLEFISSYGMIKNMKGKKPDKFFNVILNSIADGVFTTDHQGKITFINKAAEEITGFSSKEAIGQYCFDVFRADICQTRCALMISVTNPLKSSGRLPGYTCCGREERCSTPPCSTGSGCRRE